MLIQNFGRNTTFTPKHYYQPKNEQEVLEILNRHNTGKIRAWGSGHAWNDGITSDDVFIDTTLLNQIQVYKGENPRVIVGGGCKLHHLVDVVTSHGFIVPTMGGIMKQSVAGLASTATHGSGSPSFSHFIQELRIAAYDKTGEAKIYTHNSGDELLAARTAVGCMGIIVSMTIPLIPRFWMEETQQQFLTLDEVLSNETYFPQQQTALIPHKWSYVSFGRKIVQQEPGMYKKIKAAWMRTVDYILVELMPHVLLKTILPLNNPKLVVNYYKFLPRVLRSITTVNEDYKGLTLHILHHYTFRHLEMEVFIPEENLKPAIKTIKEITNWFAGTQDILSQELSEKLNSTGLLSSLEKAKGTYTHHYIMFIRKIFPDQTLISMTAGNTSYYSVGIFTYKKDEQRKEFYEYAYLLAKILATLYSARLHWGKYFPLNNSDIEKLYPQLPRFREICKSVDPNGVFQNEFTKKTLGF